MVARPGRRQSGRQSRASLFGQASFHSRSVLTTIGVNGTVALAGFGLGVPDRAVAIGALADVKFALLKVDVGPAQTTKLRSPKAGEDRGQQIGRQRPLAASTMALISSRVGMSTPILSLPFWRRSALRSAPRCAGPTKIADDVARD